MGGAALKITQHLDTDDLFSSSFLAILHPTLKILSWVLLFHPVGDNF
jgi:hypothetical protein